MSGQVSPSLLYATAAVLEGCSFVNGGSQNTVQAGLVELGEQSAAPCYVLGTDFKAGQTKAKTAIVEYLRALALRPLFDDPSDDDANATQTGARRVSLWGSLSSS